MVYFNRHLVANRIKVDLCAHSLITTVKEARGAAGVTRDRFSFYNVQLKIEIS